MWSQDRYGLSREGTWFSDLSICIDIWLAEYKTAVTPLLSQWSYCSLELSHRYIFAHYNDAIISAMASQITSPTIAYSTVYSGTDQRKHQSSASLAFVRGIHRGLVNSPHKWPVTRKMFQFDDVIINNFTQIHHKITTYVIAVLRIPLYMLRRRPWHWPFVGWTGHPHKWLVMWNSVLFCVSRFVEQIVEFPIIWDTMTLMWHHCNDKFNSADLE